MVDDTSVDHRRSVADAYALQPLIRAPSTAALQTNKLHDSACCRPIATWWACSLLTGMHLAAALAFAVAWTPYGSGNTGWSPTPVTRFVHQAFVGSGGRKGPHSAVGAVLCWVLEAKVGSLLGRMLPPSILAGKPTFGGAARRTVQQLRACCSVRSTLISSLVRVSVL